MGDRRLWKGTIDKRGNSWSGKVGEDIVCGSYEDVALRMSVF